MACGLATVATEVGCHGEVLRGAGIVISLARRANSAWPCDFWSITRNFATCWEKKPVSGW